LEQAKYDKVEEDASTTLISSLVCSSTLKMEAKYLFEASVEFQRLKYLHVSEERSRAYRVGI
jgi:hypothetical protein